MNTRSEVRSNCSCARGRAGGRSVAIELILGIAIACTYSDKVRAPTSPAKGVN